jgi:DNA-directed RNA polymerase specialized sigma24 family protein
LADLRNPARFGPWLVGIAQRVCLEWRRSRARDRHRYVGIAVDAWVDPAAPGDEALDRLRWAMARLSDKERLALGAFYLQEQPAEQARALFGFSRSGFYRLLQRARNRLESMIRDYLETK